MGVNCKHRMSGYCADAVQVLDLQSLFPFWDIPNRGFLIEKATSTGRDSLIFIVLTWLFYMIGVDRICSVR